MRKPKTIVYLSCFVRTTRNLARPEKGEAFGRLFQEAPSPLVPTHYGFWHPYREPFVPERAAEQLGSVWQDKGSNDAYLWWRGRVKGYMSIDTKRWEKATFHMIGMHVEYDDLVKLHLLDAHHRLFRGLVDLAEVAYAWVTVRAAFRGDDWYEGYKPEVVERDGVSIGPHTGGIRTDASALPPGLAWLTVFGHEHLDALGGEVETLAEVGKTWRDEAGRLWVQVAERPEEMHLPETRQRIQRVIDRIAASPAGRREPAFDRSEIHVPGPQPLPPEERYDYKYFIDIRKGPIPWAAPSERIPTGSTPSVLLGEIITVALKHRAGLEVYGVTMKGSERWLRLLKDPEKYRTQDARLSEVIRLLRADAAARKMWGAGWCVVEASSSTPSGSPASGVLRIHVESSSVPHPHEPAAFDASLPFAKKGRTIEFGELYAERSALSIFN